MDMQKKLRVDSSERVANNVSTEERKGEEGFFLINQINPQIHRPPAELCF